MTLGQINFGLATVCHTKNVYFHMVAIDVALRHHKTVNVSDEVNCPERAVAAFLRHNWFPIIDLKRTTNNRNVIQKCKTLR